MALAASTLLALPLLGVLAGALTTLAGMGGGVVMLLALSLLVGPVPAMAMTTPALLLGNLHRATRHRRAIDRRTAVALALGALPGSVAGAALLVAIPETAQRVLLVGGVVLALARVAGVASFRPPAAALVPAGFGIGAVAATAGGGGLLLGPVLMARGLTGPAYVATTAAIAVAMHVGRALAFGAEGRLDAATLTAAGVITVALLAGNLVGDRLRARLAARTATRVEVGTLVACVALSLAGVARG